MTSPILENALIERLVQGFGRSANQLNSHQESDAELIRIPGTGVVLAVTTDSIVEEIEAGLYTEPYLIGWMTVLSSVSDLAAVGAEPLGIVLSQTLHHHAGDAFLDALQRGIADACAASGVDVLGGDTNFSDRPQMGATAIGVVSPDAILTRRGCRPGDRLFATGPLGAGAAFALARFSGGLSLPELPLYRPRPRLREGRLLRGRATCAIDTSDGALAALDQLMRVNGTGFAIEGDITERLDPGASHLCRAAGLPGWMMLAGPHGEFELLFTVSKDCAAEFRRLAAGDGWTPLELGRVTVDPGLVFEDHDPPLCIDTAAVRNIPARSAPECLAELRRLNERLSSQGALS